MCASCNKEDFIYDCQTFLDELETGDFPPAADEFVDSVRTKVENMQGWARDNGHCTDKMQESLTRMMAGALRWQRQSTSKKR